MLTLAVIGGYFSEWLIWAKFMKISKVAVFAVY